jgi:endonuclease/exonuclease/phosphatase family metal-dependent hydrolase
MATTELKILTYNIHGIPWYRVPTPQLIEWIFKTSGADLVCLQEVFSATTREELCEAAAAYGWHCVLPSDTIYSGLVPRLEHGSGLLTLVHPRFEVGDPHFIPYKTVAAADRLVKKGFFTVPLTDGTTKFQLINTHMQSDISEACCFRLNFKEARHAQEKELFTAAQNHALPLIVGDENMCIFTYFHRVDQDMHVTFPDTEEHLDHLLCLFRDRERVQHLKTEYHDTVRFSDHIPVVYTVNLLNTQTRDPHDLHRRAEYYRSRPTDIQNSAVRRSDL